MSALAACPKARRPLASMLLEGRVVQVAAATGFLAAASLRSGASLSLQELTAPAFAAWQTREAHMPTSAAAEVVVSLPAHEVSSSDGASSALAAVALVGVVGLAAVGARRPRPRRVLHGYPRHLVALAARGGSDEAARKVLTCDSQGRIRFAVPGPPCGREALASPAPTEAAVAMDPEIVTEAERMFAEAYSAEAERSALLKSQVEAALSAKLAVSGGGDMKVTLEDPAVVPKPGEPGGAATWRAAYEAIKLKTASLEEQLRKAKNMGVQASPAPSVFEAMPATPSSDVEKGKQADPPVGFTDANGFNFVGADQRDPVGFQKLEDLAQNVIADEAALQLVAVPILGRRAQESLTRLPPVSKIRELVGNDQFVVAEAVEFERVCVFKGAVASSAAAGDALTTVSKRFADEGYGDSVEVFLQRSKEEGMGQRSLLVVMLKEDLPSSDFQWWQWALCLVCLVATLLSVNATTFSVSIADVQVNPNDMSSLMSLAGKTVPTAASIFAVVAGQEAARRVTARSYGVELTPPFLIPVWPFPSIGCLGAITRRLSLVPNEEASLSMALVPAVVGYLIAFAILFLGLSMGPDPDKLVNLNFQLLPLVLKVVLKPFLGAASVTDQPDPFDNPLSIAFPANPVTIGGIISLIVVSLNLLPIGRLDGGTIVKSILGGRIGGLVGFLGLALTLLGATAPNDTGLLYITFGFFAVVLQNGNEVPARDTVSELDTFPKAIGLLLVALGILLTIPGSLLPNI